MTLFQDPDAVPRTAASRLADVLDAFGAVGDRAAGNPSGTARRKAAAAVSIARAARAEFELLVRNARPSVETVAPHPNEVDIIAKK